MSIPTTSHTTGARARPSRYAVHAQFNRAVAAAQRTWAERVDLVWQLFRLNGSNGLSRTEVALVVDGHSPPFSRVRAVTLCADLEQAYRSVGDYTRLGDYLLDKESSLLRQLRLINATAGRSELSSGLLAGESFNRSEPLSVESRQAVDALELFLLDLRNFPVVEQAARLACRIVKNKPFRYCNRLTAWLGMQVILVNGGVHPLLLAEDELESTREALTRHEWRGEPEELVDLLAELIERHCTRR